LMRAYGVLSTGYPQASLMPPSVTLKMDWVGLPYPRHDDGAVIAIGNRINFIDPS
jgi:hypothetical protein